MEDFYEKDIIGAFMRIPYRQPANRLREPNYYDWGDV
jgi:hypothetical protein